jgi:hypothetical protein
MATPHLSDGCLNRIVFGGVHPIQLWEGSRAERRSSTIGQLFLLCKHKFTHHANPKPKIDCDSIEYLNQWPELFFLESNDLGTHD